MESIFIRIRRHAVISLAIVAGTFGVMARDIPAPWLHLSFDREFLLDGTGAGKLKAFPDSPFPGVAKVPAGEFTAGIFGKAFIPGEDLTIQGDAVFPAPEGTVSLWIKPVKFAEDWVGGPALTSGRIGPFLTTVMRGDGKVAARCSLQVRWNRHDCCSGLHWFEQWPGQIQQYRETGPNAQFNIWQEGKWRMLTVVWFKGERRIYFNGVRMQHGVDVLRNPAQPGDALKIPAGSKAVDELLVWDTPLTDAQVAALFFAKIPLSGLQGAVQHVPRLPTLPTLGQAEDDAAWSKAVRLGDWVESTSGMASEARDTLEIGHAGGDLYLRYREPMPKDYIAIKTLLGGAMLKRSVVEKDGPVGTDDSVEVRLTGDGGKTNYVFAVSASGAVYDARNGDKGFTADGWVVRQDAGETFWTVEMKIPLATLSGAATPAEWGFNFVRTVQQQGFARRQWSYAAGNEYGYGTMVLSPSDRLPIAAEMRWTDTTGKLSVAVQGGAESPLTVSSAVTPLGHAEVLPGEKEVNDMIGQTGRDKVAPPVTSEQRIPAGDVLWQSALDYLGQNIALASLTVKDEAGAVIARRTCLISGSELVSTRIYNLPSRRAMVVQVFLASETLAGKDVVADIAIIGKEGKEPVLKATIAGFDGIMKEAELDVSGIAVGDYEVATTLVKDGKLLGRKSRKWFKSGAPEWLGNEIGIIKTVPAPWTPVAKNGDSIAVWGREHSFAGSLLPVSLKVLDEEILAGPMRLLIKTAAGTLDTAVMATPVIAVDSAGLRATITGNAAGHGLVVEMAGSLEFDGFAYLTFTLKPADAKAPVAVESIVFEVPFKTQYAELYDDSSYNMFKTQSGRIAAQGMELSGTGTVRVGDTRRGVQFYPLFGTIGKRTTAKPLTFTPEANTMRMRYVVSEGMTLDQPITASLGLIGTPVKPFDAKRIRLTGTADVPADLQARGYAAATFWFSNWTNFGGGLGKESGYFNYSPEWCRGFARSMKKDWDEKRHYSLLKIQPGLITAKSPEYALFWKEWGGQYYEYLDDCVRNLATYHGAEIRPAGVWTAVDSTNRSWQDFFFYSLDKVLAACAAEGVRVGIYVDCTHHLDDPAMYRQWMQRLYQVTRQHSPDGLIMIHMSGDRRMAIWGMADLLAEGEQYSANWSAYIADKPELTLNDCHPTVLPLDRMRATYAASLWGPQTVFLSQFWTDKRQQEDVNRKEKGDPGPSYYRRMRYSTGLMLAHDTQFWGEFYACGAREEPRVKRAQWGYDETVQFIPYWDNRGMFEVEGPDRDTSVVSAWLRPDGKLMAIILNTANTAATVRLKVLGDKSPVKLQPFTKAVDITSPVPAFNPDATAPDSYDCKDGVFAVPMRPRDFRLLVFE